ncbi:MAG: hypothetical protein RSC24_06270 [Clostridium sp.]
MKKVLCVLILSTGFIITGCSDNVESQQVEQTEQITQEIFEVGQEINNEYSTFKILNIKKLKDRDISSDKEVDAITITYQYTNKGDEPLRIHPQNIQAYDSDNVALEECLFIKDRHSKDVGRGKSCIVDASFIINENVRDVISIELYDFDNLLATWEGKIEES